MAPLRNLQYLLAGIYDLPLADDIRDFVVTDRRSLPAQHAANAADEQLLVESGAGGDEMGLALYVDAAVLDRLDRSDPLHALHDGNVADYLTALEGVSHFICVAWHAQHGRDVSRLVLELQAEVDKYVATHALLRLQWPERFPAELHDLLFTRCRVDAALAAGDAGLYRRASALAARYCRRLERHLRAEARDGTAWSRALQAELRRFYRLPEMRKLAETARSAA